MKKTIIILILSILVVSCSSDNNNDDNKTAFNIELTPSTTNAVVDQEFTITINANQTFKQLWYSTDNFATYNFGVYPFGTSCVVRFNFDTLGQKTIAIRCQNQNNEVSEKQITITITRGNAVKILGVQVVSFNGINTVFDPEYPATNPESLADVKFGFAKTRLGISYLSPTFNQTYSWRSWYNSPTNFNQSSLIWDCSSNDLYVSPTKKIQFTLMDEDGSVVTDLTGDPASYKEIDFSNYTTTKPTSITYSYPEINLEFKVFVAWPN